MVCRRKKRRRIVTEEGGKAKLEHALPVSASLFSLLPVSLRFPSSAVPARASDEPPGVARPGPGGDKRRGGQAAPHEACAARGRCSSSGRPPRYPCARWGAGAGQRLRSAVDARCATPAWMRQAARAADGGGVWACREPSWCRHVCRACLRHTWRDCAPRRPAIACRPRPDVERYRRGIR